MSQHLIVRNQIAIHAPAATVWKVLVDPRFIQEWDDIPEDYTDWSDLRAGSEIVWKQENGHFSKLTVIALEPQSLVQMSLSVSTWDLELAPEDITYTYRLAEQDGMTTLSAAIGDFAKLPDGEKYYEASLEFGSSAVGKIKELAEVMLQGGGAAHARGHSQKNNR